MEKYIYNEKNGLWYELQGDYYLPCLKLPDSKTSLQLHIPSFEGIEYAAMVEQVDTADLKSAEE